MIFSLQLSLRLTLPPFSLSSFLFPQRETSVRQGLVQSSALLMNEKENVSIELRREKAGRSSLLSEVSTLQARCKEQSTDLESLQANYALAQKGVAEGKHAAEDAMKRIARVTGERDKTGAENDELARKNQVSARVADFVSSWPLLCLFVSLSPSLPHRLLPLLLPPSL